MTENRLLHAWARVLLVVGLASLLVFLLYSDAAHAQLNPLGDAGKSLGPVELIVDQLWKLETRALEKGQLAAGTLFGGLATIHLMVVALQALNRGEGLAQFQEQLLWTGAFGSAIALGPGWARAIVDFFRNVGKSIQHSPVTPQTLLDVSIELFANTGSGITEIAVSTLFVLIIALSGLIAMVIFYQETESHVIIGAGAVVLGFGGAAATREIATRYFRLALGSGLRLMLVEMINGALMETLVAGAKQAKAEGGAGLETAATLMLALLVVFGFILVLPIVLHSLSSGAISATAETLLAGLPAMAIAGGVAKAGRAVAAGFLDFGKGGSHASDRGGSTGAADASALGGAAGPTSGKRAGRGGAMPSRDAAGSARRASGASGSSASSAVGSSAAEPASYGEGSEGSQEAGPAGGAAPTSRSDSEGEHGGATSHHGHGGAAGGREHGGARPAHTHAGGAAAGAPAGAQGAAGARHGASQPAGASQPPGASQGVSASAPLPKSFWQSGSASWVGSGVSGVSPSTTAGAIGGSFAASGTEFAGSGEAPSRTTGPAGVSSAVSETDSASSGEAPSAPAGGVGGSFAASGTDFAGSGGAPSRPVDEPPSAATGAEVSASGPSDPPNSARASSGRSAGGGARTQQHSVGAVFESFPSTNFSAPASGDHGAPAHTHSADQPTSQSSPPGRAAEPAARRTTAPVESESLSASSFFEKAGGSSR